MYLVNNNKEYLQIFRNMERNLYNPRRHNNKMVITYQRDVNRQFPDMYPFF